MVCFLFFDLLLTTSRIAAVAGFCPLWTAMLCWAFAFSFISIRRNGKRIFHLLLGFFSERFSFSSPDMKNRFPILPISDAKNSFLVHRNGKRISHLFCSDFSASIFLFLRPTWKTGLHFYRFPMLKSPFFSTETENEFPIFSARFIQRAFFFFFLFWWSPTSRADGVRCV